MMQNTHHSGSLIIYQEVTRAVSHSSYLSLELQHQRK